MFKKVYRTFYYEVFFYAVDEPKATVVQRIDHLFTEKGGLFQSPNLTGKFVTYPETFYMEQKWWLANIKGFEKKPAILKGVITEVSSTRTKMEIAVRPNSIFFILAIFFLPFGVFHLYNALITREINSLLVGFFTLLFVVPFLFKAARFCTNKLRASFENYMNISPVDDDVLPTTSALV